MMKLWRVTIALPTTLIASQAIAENWITVAVGDGHHAVIDKDSIRRGSDGLVYFVDSGGGDDSETSAVDCQQKVGFLVKDDENGDYPNWRGNGQKIEAGSPALIVLQYVCANAG